MQYSGSSTCTLPASDACDAPGLGNNNHVPCVQISLRQYSCLKVIKLRWTFGDGWNKVEVDLRKQEEFVRLLWLISVVDVILAWPSIFCPYFI
jgi:hypothetical protein